MTDRTCSIDGCENTARCRGWCNAHYMKWKKYGDPLPLKPLRRGVIDHEDGTRTCAKCYVRKPIEEYHAEQTSPRGRRSKCKVCCLAIAKAWGIANRERRAAADRARRDSGAQRARDRTRGQERGHRRRARLNNAPSISGITRASLRKRHGDICPYCLVVMDFSPMNGRRYVPSRGTVEHVVPLSRGGSHTWENVILCCWQCNLRKSNKTPEEWAVAKRV